MLTATKRTCMAAAVATGLAMAQGCANYKTPASGVNVGALAEEEIRARADDDIGRLMAVRPASPFPARIAVVRIQAPGYSSRTNSGYGTGKFSVVTVRDIEDEESFSRISTLPMVAGLAPLNRLILPEDLDSIKDLRVSAARLRTDLVLIYSVDTTFHVEGSPVGPLSLIALGLLPDRKALVSSTTSAVLIDVRTGFVYGVSEATGREEQRATMWNTEETIDRARLESERTSFRGLIGELEKMWSGILTEHLSRDRT